jgi:hypothetical protein
MLRVQSAGSPCSSELRKAVSGCGCAGFATSPARSMNREFTLFCAENTRRQFAFGLAAKGGMDASRRERSHRAMPAGERFAPAVQSGRWLGFCVPCADIFCKAVSDPRREIEAARSMEALQSSTSADSRIAGPPIPALRKPDFRIAGASLRCHHSRERGMRLC